MNCVQRRARLSLFVLLGTTQFAWADFGQGLDAFRAGQYDGAREHWTSSANAGDARSQYGLGVLSNEGKGAAADLTLAAAWFRRAARQGLPEAQVELGFMLASGKGVPQDAVRAYVWFELAARSGEPNAKTYAGAVLKRLVPEEVEAAKRLLDELAVDTQFQP